MRAAGAGWPRRAVIGRGSIPRGLIGGNTPGTPGWTPGSLGTPAEGGKMFVPIGGSMLMAVVDSGGWGEK